MEKIISLAKRRGFVYPGSEIYGGLAGTWDYGPLGVLIKNNIKNLWWKKFVLKREDVFGIESAILMNSKIWEASGHLESFSEKLAEGKQFNTMFKTFIGATEDSASVIYLRPETAQGMFVNFKNIIDSFHPEIPFGIAQIGKAFRNEITPSDFIFRIREFEQMEIEYFIREAEWQKWFDYWLDEMHNWIKEIGLSKKNIRDREVGEKDRAHYSKKTIDIDYDYPFGKEELYGIAYRTDFDLKQHSDFSKEDLSYYNEETKETFIPHVIEPTFGVDRTVLALLCESYDEDEMGGEKRAVLRFKPQIAPIKVAVFPLLKNKPDLVKKAREVYELVKKGIQPVVFDDNDNIGKRYRRQDEIGTPWCITIDFDTLNDNTVTIRDRDTAKQERIDIEEIVYYLDGRLR